MAVGGGTTIIRGTSAAAAHVAGAAALLLADGVSSIHVASRLSTTAELTDKPGIGRLNLFRALKPDDPDYQDVEDVPAGDPSGPPGAGEYVAEPTPTPVPTPTPAPTPTPPPTPKPTPWPTPAGVLGLDVSHWNGLPDFKALRAEGMQFVFSKASQGTSFIDSTYRQHTAEARAAGLLAGAYHFFDYRVNGVKQAQHFLTTLRLTSGLGGLLPLVVDVESLPSLGTPDKDQARARLRAMLDELYRQTGRYPMIYTSKFMWEKVVGAPTGFGANPLWVACWKCDTVYLPRGWTSWTFWQWGQARFVDNVNLDGNVYSSSLGRLNLERQRPMKLESGAIWTGSRSVLADLRGFDGAQVRYALGDRKFGSWQPYQRRFALQLGGRQGNQQVRVQLRDPRQVKSPIMRDDIKLDTSRPKLSGPRLSIREGGHISASGRRVPVKATMNARDTRSGLKSASLRVSCNGKRRAGKTASGPGLGLNALLNRSGCSIRAVARDAVGHSAQKSISPKVQLVDASRKSKAVKFGGRWKMARNRDSLGRTLARTTSKGAQAKVNFKGRQFAVVARRGPAGGHLKVILDGKHIDTIDLYSSKTDDRRITYVRNVGKGRHVLKLRATGTANARSSGSTVWLDAVLVLDRRR